jgi:hypothetical protein
MMELRAQPAPPQRTLIIGDVHGCLAELHALLSELRADPASDRIIFIGDLINKGPDSLGVYRLFKALGAEAILGNHELRLLLEADHPRQRRPLYDRMRDEFGDLFPSLLDDIARWPLFIETEEFIVVHAGLLPNRNPHACSAEQLTNIRTWDGVGINLQDRANPPWYMFYEGRKKVVFGHWAALGGIHMPKVIGIDTGCVYGRSLTALVLPEERLVQVRALKAYCPVD